VSSEPGKGVEMRVYIPFAQAEIRAGDEEKKDDSLPGGSETILIIDDEAPVLEFGMTLLKENGYTVLGAASGAAGLEMYRKRVRDIASLSST